MIYGRNIKHLYIYIVVKVIPAQCPEWELKGAKKKLDMRDQNL